MARHPEWFERLDTIQQLVRQAEQLEWLGRKEIRAIFGCSERDSIRLLHKFGAATSHNSLCLTRSSLLTQLDAVRNSSTFAAFLQQREKVASQLATARAEAKTRQFSIRPPTPASEQPSLLENLPQTIQWRRSTPTGSARFEIVYRDGADLMTQLAAFLNAAGLNREEFFAATEPHERPGR